MTDTDRLAALLHAEFITHEMGKGSVDDTCALCLTRAEHLIAAGVTLAPAPAPLDDSVRGEWGRQTCCPFPHDEDSGPDIHPRHQRTYQPATFAAAEETP